MLSRTDTYNVAGLLARAILDAMGTPENGRVYEPRRLTLSELNQYHRAPRVIFCGRALRHDKAAIVRALLHELYVWTGDPRYINARAEDWLGCLVYEPRDGAEPAGVKVLGWPIGILKAPSTGSAGSRQAGSGQGGAV